MDLLRSCYKTDMRFWSGGPPISVRWFFLGDNAKPLSFPTTFNSRNWTKQDAGWPEIGEVEDAERVWNDGRLPSWAGAPTAEIGSADDFLDGLPGPTAGIEVSGDCVPLGLFNPPPGGFKLNGQATMYNTKWITTCCPLGLPKIMRLYLRALADPNPYLPPRVDLIWFPFFSFLLWASAPPAGSLGFILFCSVPLGGIRLQYNVLGNPLFSAGPSNVYDCADFIGNWTGQLPPPDPDPFAFYLYNMAVRKPTDPAPW